MLFTLPWSCLVNRLLLSLLFGFSFILYTNSISMVVNKPKPIGEIQRMYAESQNLENCLRIANVSSPAKWRHIPMGPTFRSRGPPPPPMYA